MYGLYIIKSINMCIREHNTKRSEQPNATLSGPSNKRVLFVAGHALVNSSEADLCLVGIERCTDDARQ